MDQQVALQSPQAAPSQPEENKDQKNSGANPILAIAVAIVIALILAGISLLIFLRSDTYHSEQLTSKPDISSPTSESLSENPDESGVVKPEDLDAIEDAIKQSAGTVSSDEFDSSEISDSALGL